jgi:hypothetical protein
MLGAHTFDLSLIISAFAFRQLITRDKSDIGGARFMEERSNISTAQTFDLSPIINADIVCVRKSIAR